MHKADEYVELADLDALTAVYGDTLERYFRRGPVALGR
jgi:acetylornithine deacetylase/succinyl-diaminopimelate desuccinylase-like protein